MTEETNVSSVACIGTGLIGAGWVASFLAAGIKVTAFDPAPDAEKTLRARLEKTAITFDALRAVEARQERLVFVSSIEEAVAEAAYVQESGPEDIEFRKQIIGAIDGAAKPGVVIASSTSAQPVSAFGVDATKDPSRLLVAHPFNPVYLMPLVELVPGPATSKEASERAASFLESIGKTVLVLDREVRGFVANRLQEAIWREALHMVVAGEATMTQIDLAVQTGLAPRWSAVGPCLSYHLAWGAMGMKGLLDICGGGHPGWARLDPPNLLDEDKKRVLAQINDRLDGRPESDWMAHRDQKMMRILKAADN